MVTDFLRISRWKYPALTNLTADIYFLLTYIQLVNFFLLFTTLCKGTLDIFLHLVCELILFVPMRIFWWMETWTQKSCLSILLSLIDWYLSFVLYFHKILDKVGWNCKPEIIFSFPWQMFDAYMTTWIKRGFTIIVIPTAGYTYLQNWSQANLGMYCFFCFFFCNFVAWTILNSVSHFFFLVPSGQVV